MPTLPFEIIVVILSLLPTKTLVKLQCVCKAWHNLIRNPMFIRKHFQNRASEGDGYLLYLPMEYTTDRSFKLLCDKTFDEAPDMEIPFEHVSMDIVVVGSCNGLLCLTDTNSFGTTIYLCNPSIRQYRVINFPISNVVESLDQRHVHVALGFGYCDEGDDYKIVRIVSSDDEDAVEYNNGVDPSLNGESVKCKIEVYSLSTNSWKNIEVDYFPWNIHDIRSEVVFSGSVHWKVTCRDGKEDTLVILAFHLGEEAFRQISLPNYEVDGEDLIEYMGIFKGNLSLFLFHFVDQHPMQDLCYLWVMKEYGVVSSWTKMYSIVVDPGVVIPFLFTRNDEIIFEDGEQDLIICNFDSNTTRVLGVGEQGYLNFVNYVDSLVLLQG